MNRPQRQGISVWCSALTAAIHVEGVERLELLEPAANIVLDPTQAGTCTAIDLKIYGETDDD
ncbi:hypothetical protein D3C72_1936900 [compost metagenome]